MTSTEELGQEMASLSAHIDAATHRMLACIRRFDEAGGWHEQGAASCAHWLAWRVGLDPGTAREKVRVARALGKLPAIDQAFGSAILSYAKVRALTRCGAAGAAVPGLSSGGGLGGGTGDGGAFGAPAIAAGGNGQAGAGAGA